MSDDPEPTDFGHYEIYTFTSGTLVDGARSTSSGIDFNYGGAEDLQLTAVLPYDSSSQVGGQKTSGVGNIELAAKYKFLHEKDVGWDVAVFPRVFFPAVTSGAAEDHASLWLPIWVEKDWDGWSTFGGAGYTINHGAGYRNWVNYSWAVTHDFTKTLHIGLEIYHQEPAQKPGLPSTGMNLGVIYDLDDHIHLLSAAGPGLQNAASTNRWSWYGAVLFTF